MNNREKNYTTIDKENFEIVIDGMVDVVDRGTARIAKINGISVAGNISLEGISEMNSYELYQNVPNPFNGTTSINFYVPENVEVEISVYNMLGEHVADVTNDIFNAGKHEVVFDASSLGQGTYFVRMTTEGFTASKNMNIVK